LPGTIYDFDGKHFDSTGYGIQKLAGECAGKGLADSGAVKTFIAIRIGWCQENENVPDTLTLKLHTGTSRDIEEPKDLAKWFKLLWISNRDICHLFERTLLADVSGFQLINGMSKNTGMVWDIKHTTDIVQYNPQDGIDVIHLS